MNLLYCIPALYNAAGMERVLTEKVNYLAGLTKYKITIVTTDQQGKAIRFLLHESIDVIHLDIDFTAHYAANLIKKYVLHKRKIKIYKQELTNLANKLNIDICVSLCGKEIEFLYKMPVNCKKVAEIHFAMNSRKQFMTSHNNGYLWKILGEIRTIQLIKSVSKLDKLVVLTKDDQLQWEKTCKNIIQIPNPNPLKKGLTSKLDTKRIISIGRLDAQKGYDMLICAWLLVIDKHPDWIIDIYGEGEWEDKLNNSIKDAKITNSFFLRGLTYDVATNYIESSIYVMSSRYEGLPMVLIEAMSCGLPIVSFDCDCGPREVITDGVNGFLVETNDIKALADKISILIENEKLRIEMGKNAHIKSKQFSINQIMPQWTLLFDELIKN